ncbi:hypothetical protein DSECCO2_565980 [anaerobic digester metagenome]
MFVSPLKSLNMMRMHTESLLTLLMLAAFLYLDSSTGSQWLSMAYFCGEEEKIRVPKHLATHIYKKLNL